MKKAFTLIELLVVISIISLLSSIVMASLNSARDKGRMAAGKQFEANVFHAGADQAALIWDFDDCTGTAVADGSGNGNNGVLTSGASFTSTTTPGGVGCAASFDGSDDYVNLANPQIADLGVYTVSAWVRTNNAAAEQMIAGRAYLQPTLKGWYMEIYQSKFNVGINNNSQLQGTTALGSNTWYHVAFTYDGATLKLFVNGALDRSASNANGTTNPTGALWVGKYTNGGTLPFNGFIDNVRVFTKDLTAQEIGSLYAAELASHPNLAAAH